MKLNPFRLKYWIICRHYAGLTIVKTRTASGARDVIHELVDGPFDTQEDAARSLAFWRQQFKKSSIKSLF